MLYDLPDALSRLIGDYVGNVFECRRFYRAIGRLLSCEPECTRFITNLDQAAQDHRSWQLTEAQQRVGRRTKKKPLYVPLLGPQTNLHVELKDVTICQIYYALIDGQCHDSVHVHLRLRPEDRESFHQLQLTIGLTFFPDFALGFERIRCGIHRKCKERYETCKVNEHMPPAPMRGTLGKEVQAIKVPVLRDREGRWGNRDYVNLSVNQVIPSCRLLLSAVRRDAVAWRLVTDREQFTYENFS
jgi:hypothetical protein